MSWLVPRDFFEPFREIDRMMERMNSWLLQPDREWQPESFTLALNVREDENDIIVETAIPGVSEEDIDVKVVGDMLTISAESQREQEREGDGWYVRELRFGKFERSIRLPTEVKADKAEAELENGILTIRLPKAKPGPLHRIAVKAKKLLASKN